MQKTYLSEAGHGNLIMIYIQNLQKKVNMPHGFMYGASAQIISLYL